MTVYFDPLQGQIQFVPGGASGEKLSVIPAGAINGVNRLFVFPERFSQVGIYLNGVRLLEGSDYVLTSTGGTGYNAVQLTVAPDAGVNPDVVSGDYVVA